MPEEYKYLAFISYKRDGKCIVSASYNSKLDNTVKLWEFSSLQEIIDETRERFKNNQLTDDERIEYYLE